MQDSFSTPPRPASPASAEQPPPPPSLSESAVADRLRAAGCVFAEDEARLLISAAAGAGELRDMVERRAGGLPLEHVVGWAEFAGRRIAVDPGVFVPRRRTEFLAGQAVAHGRPGAVVVDLCCGSGALGVVLAEALGAAELHAADLDPAAVRCARRNVLPLGGRVYEGDLFAALPPDLRGRIDVLAANVPYVPTGSVALLPAEARDHEALIALDGGPDGLDTMRRVAAEARYWLAPGGVLLFESSRQQAPQALEIVTAGGLDARSVTDEDQYATVLIGTKRAG
ncbi:putative protein N(5)-glutamine methyltransferase [Streptomyces sp. NBC_01476]|uniref:putative protein N(5)-glutamine methyltransferase n=1 Tax=Streptomyces sp. NBC_01476 TaxID=2903881 RepID=UPI002E358118|nr:putative protein N(5)-glutamine methyltransferase [Streptomyces sp. NBC_01476]